MFNTHFVFDFWNYIMPFTRLLCNPKCPHRKCYRKLSATVWNMPDFQSPLSQVVYIFFEKCTWISRAKISTNYTASTQTLAIEPCPTSTFCIFKSPCMTGFGCSECKYSIPQMTPCAMDNFSVHSTGYKNKHIRDLTENNNDWPMMTFVKWSLKFTLVKCQSVEHKPSTYTDPDLC